MLFATLDPTMRRVELEEGPEIILSDTVGFISDLPTQLVAAFRATLEEVLEADLVLHVRDIAHPETEEQAQDVNDILQDLGLDEQVPVLEIWNKIDLVDPEKRAVLEGRAEREEDTLAISAVTGEGLDRLLALITDRLSGMRFEAELDLGFADGRKRAWLYEQNVVQEEAQTETGQHLRVLWTPVQEARFRRL
jgi:GTP-binding protein HflX